MNKPYIKREYQYDSVLKRKVFRGFACGINGTSYHAIYRKKSDADLFNKQSLTALKYSR